LVTPDGTPYKGFKVSIGGIQDPSEVRRTYDDVEAILHKNQVEYKVHEERTPQGTFKSYSVSTY
jgi:hypothetical protein